MLKERNAQQLTAAHFEATKDLWSANLHGRHELLLWKWMNKAVSTLDRIQHFIVLNDHRCYICGEQDESIHHLVFECPLSKMIWWNSPWQIRIEGFKQLSIEEWMSLMLGKLDFWTLSEIEHTKLKYFMATAIEQILLTRN